LCYHRSPTIRARARMVNIFLQPTCAYGIRAGMTGKIIWSMVPDFCPCHGLRDCDVAVRMRQERERILAALDEANELTPPVVVLALRRAMRGAEHRERKD
jgi:hypothetical protein